MLAATETGASIASAALAPCVLILCGAEAGFISGLAVPETTAVNFTASGLGLCGAE